jgi:hypothetical protein
MSTQNARSQGRRSRGGRRRHRNDDGRTDRIDRPAPQYQGKPRKLTFWQKVIAFFKGKQSPAVTAPRDNGSAPAKPRPEYTPRTATVTTPPRPARKPEAVEVTSPKLYVGNLSFDATESDLAELFGGVGSVQTAEVVSHKATDKSKGFGFVMMATVDEAKRAVETLHDKDFMGRKLVVSGAKTNDRQA